MGIEHNFLARTTAGRAAISIASEHDRDTARDMTQGLMTGFLLACVQYDGWDATLRAIQELAAASRVPAFAEKPKLCLVNREEVA